MRWEENKPLQKLHTFGIDVKARYYAYLDTVADLVDLLARPTIKPLPKLILGQGSNILFVEDFEGLVIQIGLKGIEKVRENKEHVWLRVGASVDWHHLVTTCIEAGYGGIENLSLIPGTVGAAPIQNIGAYGVELSDVINSVGVLEVATGKTKTFTKSDCEFGYRYSVFKGPLQDQYVVLWIVLRLDKNPVFRTDHGAIQAVLETMGVQELSLKAISNAIVQIRRQKLPDPTVVGSAGSFFENPIIELAQALALQEAHPGLSMHPLPHGRIKLSAAWLIDQCGWKGYRQGNVGISSSHALVLVHYGHGTGQALFKLAQLVQESVWQKFGIRLVPEVNIIARSGLDLRTQLA
jgi:UDP-N-acetylmuramate dehydrogenase